MYLSITTGSADKSKAELVASFLRDFLPRVRDLPGVKAVYHYDVGDKGVSTTIIVWESKEALMAYRQGDLIKSAIEFESRNGLTSTRESYQLSIAL